MITADKNKKEKGQFFTITNPFHVEAFYKWIDLINDFSNQVILEPFAGSNNIVKLVNEMKLNGTKVNDWKCYDIDTSYENVVPEYQIEYRDSISSFPTGYDVIITNPPYLAKNSATRNNLYYPITTYDDLYKYCVKIMLNNAKYVAAIIPESFITANLFRNRLYAVVSLTCKMFEDTQCPVCLALFVPTEVKKQLIQIREINDNLDFMIYRMNYFISTYYDIEQHIDKLLPLSTMGINWEFNNKQGSVGIRCIDNDDSASIEFVDGDRIDISKIKDSSRNITRVSGLPKEIDLHVFLNEYNRLLSLLRDISSDVCLTSFKELRNDGLYRRRLDYITAKRIMNTALANITYIEDF